MVFSPPLHLISFIPIMYLLKRTIFFFFNDPATTEIYPFSLHDALPISLGQLVQRSAVTVFSSPVAAEEMGKIPAPYYAEHIQQYHAVGNVSSNLTWEEYNPATEVTDLEEQDPIYEGLCELLPDDTDAQHLAQAKLNGIDNVITLDQRT